MLNLDFATLLWQMLNFLVLAAILGKLLFQPALRYMRERAARVEQSLDEASKAQTEAEALRQLLSERLSGAQEKADRIVRESREKTEEQAWGMLRKAEAEAQALLADARSTIKQERAQKIAQSYDEVLETVIELTSITLKKTASQAVNDNLINDFNSHIWRLGQTDRERVDQYRSVMAERQPLARVYAPATLSQEQQRTLTDTLSALINQPVTLAIEVDPDLALAYNNRGWAYIELEQYEQAVADCTKAIELDPELALAYSNRGLAYLRLGQYEQTVADCTRAIELDPDLALAYNNRGQAYLELEQYDQAVADFDRAIEIDPGIQG